VASRYHRPHGHAHILSTLRRKREEIEAVISALEARVALAKLDLAHVDRTLALFSPDLREPAADYFKIGRRGGAARSSRYVAPRWLKRVSDARGLTSYVIAAKELKDAGPIMRRAGERHDRRWSLRR
jgi:hypothetical protein